MSSPSACYALNLSEDRINSCCCIYTLTEFTFEIVDHLMALAVNPALLKAASEAIKTRQKLLNARIKALLEFEHSPGASRTDPIETQSSDDSADVHDSAIGTDSASPVDNDQAFSDRELDRRNSNSTSPAQLTFSKPSRPDFTVTLAEHSSTVKNGMFDTGADDVILPKWLPKWHIPDELLKHLQSSKFTFTGVNSETKARGESRAIINFSDSKSAGTRILVTDGHNAPPLISRTVTDHAANVPFGETGTKGIFQRRDSPGAGIYTQARKIKSYARDPWNALLIDSGNPSSADFHSYADARRSHPSQAAKDQLNPPAPGPNTSTSDLLSYLQSQKELVLPSYYHNRSELHELAVLCVQYEDVSGSSTDELGLFYRPVRTPTNGEFPNCAGKRLCCTKLDTSTTCSVARVSTGERANVAARTIVEVVVFFALPDTLHDPDVRYDSPETYGNRIQMLSKLAKIANRSADLALERQHRRLHRDRLLKYGDMVHLYQPVTKVAKDSNCHWIGPYEIASKTVVKIVDGADFRDWAHRSHLRLVPPRNDHLKSPSDLALVQELICGDDPDSPQNLLVGASGSYPEPLAKIPKVGRPAAEKQLLTSGMSTRKKRKRARPDSLPDPKRQNTASLPPSTAGNSTAPARSTSTSTTPRSTDLVENDVQVLPVKTTSAPRGCAADSLHGHHLHSPSSSADLCSFFGNPSVFGGGIRKKTSLIRVDHTRKSTRRKREVFRKRKLVWCESAYTSALIGSRCSEMVRSPSGISRLFVSTLVQFRRPVELIGCLSLHLSLLHFYDDSSLRLQLFNRRFSIVSRIWGAVRS